MPRDNGGGVDAEGALVRWVLLPLAGLRTRPAGLVEVTPRDGARDRSNARAVVGRSFALITADTQIAGIARRLLGL